MYLLLMYCYNDAHDGNFMCLIVPNSAFRGKWGNVNQKCQMSSKVCILQTWLFLCIKLIVRVNMFKNVKDYFALKYIYIYIYI